ncbi:uncharacterized protein LODBEIA_P10010 [Lodderomyces beijingensis]|uniref:Uncharacterized protein n=1 Tax=Lodderomyces beijingensis TaxID=1775926 RepID=A0ABP0ZF44_9ASCO
MIDHGFYHDLAQLETDDLELFQQISCFMKLLVEYTLQLNDIDNDHDHDHDNGGAAANTGRVQQMVAISEILGYHLFTLQKSQQLVGYKMPYIQRLVNDCLKICQLHPSIVFQTWLEPIDQLNTPYLCSPYSAFVKSVAYHDKLPLYNLIKSLLISPDGTVVSSAANWIALLQMSQSSSYLEQFLMNKVDLVEFFIDSYYESLFKLNFLKSLKPQHQVNILKQFILPVMENCSGSIREIYFDEIFMQKFEYVMINYKANADKLINSILDAFESTTCPTILNIFITNETMVKYMICKFDQPLHLNNLLIHLTRTMQRHSSTMLELFGTEEGDGNNSNNKNNNDADDDDDARIDVSCSMTKLSIQVMQLHHEQTQELVDTFEQLINTTGHANIKSSQLDANLPLSNSYLRCLLQFFHHAPELNASLVKFSTQLAINFNVLANALFIKIIDHLNICSEIYSIQLQKYDNLRFDSIELTKLVNLEVITPGSELLTKYDISPVNKLDYLTLAENLSLFKSLMTDLYICCKMRIISSYCSS